ncbi:MAG: protoporphyrinogen oxidase [Hyphomicrobiales bacterium]|jgi:menaquinone-dependent protoporphyrinogen oxidase|nr:protoporphyrinogen oxidase [Hyphomicrobiales bacterium]
MNILILFGSTEGQTRKIAMFVRDRLEGAGHKVRLLEASVDIDVDVAMFDRVIIAASLHAGDYQPAVVAFATAHHALLNRMDAAFLSVSLSAAGKDKEDVDGLASCVTRFAADTGWHPARIEHVAGAFRFTRYDLMKRWALRYIAWKKGQSTDTSRDHELTDWDALAQFAVAIASSAPLTQVRA